MLHVYIYIYIYIYMSYHIIGAFQDAQAAEVRKRDLQLRERLDREYYYYY